MLLILSGEGPSDIGSSINGESECGLEYFRPGPLAYHLFFEIEKHIQYSPLDPGLVFWISRTKLSRIYAENRQSIHVAFPGAKSPKEMLSSVRMAYAFAIRAQEIEVEQNCLSVGVLFHDSDGTNSDSINRWEHMASAVSRGFCLAGYRRGVPMIPKPKQEAWFLCGLKSNPYAGCDAIEGLSGNDASPNNLKKILGDVLDKKVTTEDLVEIIQSNKIDWDRIDMPSYLHFRRNLLNAINEWKNG